jgi:tetratricopeptide (TPR) repeat protein
MKGILQDKIAAMRVFGAAILVVATAMPALAQTAAPADPKAQALFEFLMARRMEAEGDTAGALAALERAKALDPGAAEIPAEMAGLYSRQNRSADAVTAAQHALTLDSGNVEAHHVLAMVFSAMADGAAPPPAGQTAATVRRSAIEHLTAIQATPLMATNPNLQMTLGRLHLREGRADLAVPILEKVAQQVPWAAEPLIILYEAQATLGRMDAAGESLAAAAEINPRYWPTLGQFFERREQWANAVSAYEQALAATRQPSRDLQVRYAAALINTESGASKARGVLGDLLKASPNDARVLYLLAMAERTDRDLPAAEATARRMLALDPTSVTGLRALVAVLFDRYDYRQVADVVAPLVTDLSRARGREFEGAAVLVQLGIAQQQLAQWDAAIAAFTAAKSLTPRDPELDAYLVQAHLAARQFDRAEALAREALARDPGQPRMVRLRAQALLKAGQAAEATALLEKGAAAEPDNRDYVIGLADLYADQRRTDDAVRILERARTTFGDDQTIAMRLAAVYDRGGRLDDAERELRRLIAADPLNGDALNSLAYLLADRGLKLPEAVALAQRALQVEPDNPAYLDTLGWALFKQGRIDEAAGPLGRAAGMLIGNSVIQDHHGDLLMRRGRGAEAIAAWERALAGDGEEIERVAGEQKTKSARACAK